MEISKEEINAYIKAFLKENLTIKIDIEEDHLMNNINRIKVKAQVLILEEMISEGSDYFEIDIP